MCRDSWRGRCARTSDTAPPLDSARHRDRWRCNMVSFTSFPTGHVPDNVLVKRERSGIHKGFLRCSVVKRRYVDGMLLQRIFRVDGANPARFGPISTSISPIPLRRRLRLTNVPISDTTRKEITVTETTVATAMVVEAPSADGMSVLDGSAAMIRLLNNGKCGTPCLDSGWLLRFVDAPRTQPLRRLISRWLPQRHRGGLSGLCGGRERWLFLG